MGSWQLLHLLLRLFFRLYQEVWSNAIVVASFFGPMHSFDWWLAACLSTAIPAVYVLIGGLRASLTSDMVQAVGAVAFLIGVLAILGANNLANFGTYNPAGSCANGVNPWNATSQECLQAGGVSFTPQGTPQDLVRAASVYAPATCNYNTVVNESVCESPAVGGLWYPANCTFTREPQCSSSGGAWDGRTVVSLEGGLDLLFTGLLQGMLSYAFFDPVLTDRAFLAAPKTMLPALLLGGAIAAAFIVLFSFLGIFGNMQATLDPQSVDTAIFTGMLAGNPASVAKFFGTGVYSIVNILFITSSISTLDSTFSSASKLVGLEIWGVLGREQVPLLADKATKRHLLVARAMTIILPIIGILPLIANVTALEATTVSGTVVLGLGPPIWATTFIQGYRPLVFHLPFWFGVAMGLTYQLSTSSCCKDSMDLSGFAIGSGSYAILFGVNLFGAAVAWGLAGVALLENLGAVDLGPLPADVKMAPWKRLLRRFGRCCGLGSPVLGDESGAPEEGTLESVGAETGVKANDVEDGNGKELRESLGTLHRDASEPGQATASNGALP